MDAFGTTTSDLALVVRHEMEPARVPLTIKIYFRELAMASAESGHFLARYSILNVEDEAEQLLPVCQLVSFEFPQIVRHTTPPQRSNLASAQLGIGATHKGASGRLRG